MFSYLITFHMNNGHTYETVLIGKSLEDIEEKVYEILHKKERFSHFFLKDNKNVYFIAVYENISIIEIELLSAEAIVEFKELINLTKEELSLILAQVNNDFVIGISLLHTEPAFINKFYESLPDRRKQVIADIIKLELGKIKMSDVLQAQNEILQVVEKLYEKGEIHIHFKDEA